MRIDEQHDYATTQAIPPETVAELVQSAREQIDPADLDPEEGFGDDPHVTILYGFADAQRDEALEIMRRAGELRAKVKAVDIFEPEDRDYDVVIFALESDDLARLRAELNQLPNDNEWPEYKPHMTVAYVKKGTGKKYKSSLKSELIGAQFPVEKLEFSGADGDVATVDLPGASEAYIKPFHDALLAEQSPLFGTDLTEDPELEARVEALLYPILNRANRRIAHVEPHGPVVSVLLDNGAMLEVTPTDADSGFIEHNGETFSSNSPTGIETLVKRVNGEVAEQADDPVFPVPSRKQAPRTKATARSSTKRKRAQPYEPMFPKYAKKMGQPVGAAPEGEPASAAPGAHVAPGRAPAQPMPSVPQSNKVRVDRAGGGYSVVVDQPVGYDAQGRRFDRATQIAQELEQKFDQSATVRQTSANSVSIQPHGAFDPNALRQALAGYTVTSMPAPERKGLMRRAAGALGRVGRKALGKLGGGVILSDEVDEDTYTSDVSFSDTIPITTKSKRRRKVKLPGLKDAVRVRKTVNRSYNVRESMSRSQSPILLVISPDKLAALSNKPVWSALRESGVIDARPFKMGEDDLVEVRIDTLRKEWTQANASVLLDEVGSVDPIAQRKVMEGFDTQKIADYVIARLPEWCQSVPVEVAIAESETFAAVHRQQRLTQGALDEAWVAEHLAGDVTITRRALEWYRISKPVLELLRAIDKPAVATAAQSLLEDETPGAPPMSVGSGMPTGNPAGAVTQGYSEQEPTEMTSSSRNWNPGDLFKLHVLVGDAPRWVYREVVGHEGEGANSMLTYRSDDGRVMSLPHDQIDQAAGYGAVVSPEQFGALEPAAPEPEKLPPGMEPRQEPAEAVDEMGEVGGPRVTAIGGENREADALRRDNVFAQAITKYQASKDPRDWEEVRKQAERQTGKTGPELDELLAVFGSERATEDRIVDAKGKKIVASTLVSTVEDDRLAEAVRLFTEDEDFNNLLDKFHSTKNDGYLIRATEQAARVSGLRVVDARSLVEELLAAQARYR